MSVAQAKAKLSAILDKVEHEWPETVKRWLEVKRPVKIRNFAGFEAHRRDLGEPRDVKL